MISTNAPTGPLFKLPKRKAGLGANKLLINWLNSGLGLCLNCNCFSLRTEYGENRRGRMWETKMKRGHAEVKERIMYVWLLLERVSLWYWSGDSDIDCIRWFAHWWLEQDQEWNTVVGPTTIVIPRHDFLKYFRCVFGLEGCMNMHHLVHKTTQRPIIGRLVISFRHNDFGR